MTSEFVLQHPGELKQFIAILKKEKVKSYLEIGSKYGGSLLSIGNALPGCRMVSVDLPVGPSLERLKRTVDALCRDGIHTELMVGDSTNPDIVSNVALRAPFDACL